VSGTVDAAVWRRVVGLVTGVGDRDGAEDRLVAVPFMF
jgi:hypothetical protein